MKKGTLLALILGLIALGCSKKTITNNYYGPAQEGASVVGVVHPPESRATVTAYMGIPVASAQIDQVGYYQFSGLPAGSYSLVVQADGYYDERANVSLKEQATLVLDTIYLAGLGDWILSVAPRDGQQMVGVGTSIGITFRTEIETKSFETAFSIEPAVEGIFNWFHYYSHGQSPGVSFAPREHLATSTAYQVTIDTSASDISGTRLSEPYQFSFFTEPLRVEYTSPAHNSTWVPPDTDIRVRFNAFMDTESAEAAFRMTNSELDEVTGYLSWSNPTYMRFEPNSPLATSETYLVTIDATASDAKGSRLPSPYWSSFTTQPVLVESTSPMHQSSWVSTKTVVRIRFNTNMNTESANSAFEMADSELNQVTGEFIWQVPSYLDFLPHSELANDETYTVTIGTGAKDMYGTALRDPFSFWFRTRPE